MATPHHPRRGSKGYYPRVRSKRMQGDIRSWPEVDGPSKIMAFAGYKVGMTHVEMVDYRKSSVTAGQSIVAPVTVVEVPPLNVVGIRLYKEDYEGLKVNYEQWADNLDKNLGRRTNQPKEHKKKTAPKDFSQVRLIVSTNPKSVGSVPTKTPDIFEVNVSGATNEEKLKYAQDKLGKPIAFSEFSKTGNFVDVIGVTKGKGFTGHVERFGVKLLSKHNRKHRRMIGTLGPWHPDWVRNTVPQAGQKGTHQRTFHNMRVIKFSAKEDGEDINVKGGFPGYGVVKNDYVLIHGSVPGPSKRLIKFREPSRQRVSSVESLTLSYVSRESKQGD